MTMWHARRAKHDRITRLIRLRNECVAEWRGIYDARAVYGEVIAKLAGKVIRGN